jgi:hypothetical protein
MLNFFLKKNFILLDQDISGDVLLNLTHEGLKELGINTYGRRYRVINAIKTLKRVSAEEYDNHNNCLSPRKNDMYTFNPDTLSSVDSIASNSPLFPKQPCKCGLQKY